MVVGDRDNGRIDKVYNSEDDAVKDMIHDIRRSAIKRKAWYQKNPNNSELNNKILNISTYIDAQLTGYKGYVILEERDRETCQSNWLAVHPNIDGSKGKEIRSFLWQSDSNTAAKDKLKALDKLKDKIDNDDKITIA